MLPCLCAGHRQAQPIDFSRVDMHQLSTEVISMDNLNDDELDQYLLPNGAPNPYHPLNSQAANSGDPSYPAFSYGPTSSTQTTWASPYRVSSGVPSYAMSSMNNNSNIPPHYEMSHQHSPPQAPPQQQSPPLAHMNSSLPSNAHGTYQGSNQCKYRDLDHPVKLEHLSPHHESYNRENHSYDVPTTQRFDVDSSQTSPSQYSPNNVPNSFIGHSLPVNGAPPPAYPFMGLPMPKPMFNAISVTADQQWDRYT